MCYGEKYKPSLILDSKTNRDDTSLEQIYDVENSSETEEIVVYS